MRVPDYKSQTVTNRKTPFPYHFLKAQLGKTHNLINMHDEENNTEVAHALSMFTRCETLNLEKKALHQIKTTFCKLVICSIWWYVYKFNITQYSLVGPNSASFICRTLRFLFRWL